MRLDKWLWAARFFKTRSLAADAIHGGKVQLGDTRVKVARDLRIGDRLTINQGDTRWEVIVQALSDRRGPAAEARLLYAETPDSVAARATQKALQPYIADPAADLHGRPTKRDRRHLGRLG